MAICFSVADKFHLSSILATHSFRLQVEGTLVAANKQSQVLHCHPSVNSGKGRAMNTAILVMVLCGLQSPTTKTKQELLIRAYPHELSPSTQTNLGECHLDTQKKKTAGEASKYTHV